MHRPRPFVPCSRMFHKTSRRVCIILHSPLERFVAGHVCVGTQTGGSRRAPCALRRDSSERCLLSSASGQCQRRRCCRKATAACFGSAGWTATGYVEWSSRCYILLGFDMVWFCREVGTICFEEPVTSFFRVALSSGRMRLRGSTKCWSPSAMTRCPLYKRLFHQLLKRFVSFNVIWRFLVVFTAAQRWVLCWPE